MNPSPKRTGMSVPAVLGLVGAIIFAGLAVLTVIGLVWGDTADPEPTPAAAAPTTSSAPSTAPSASPTAAAAAPSPSRVALTAKQVADRLAELYPLPNPTDNTGSCAAKPGDTGKGCKQLITTDSVSVYEFEDAATAKKWVTAMRKQGDWRQAGRYALAWTARDQALTSKEARSKMVAAVRALA